MIGVRDEGLVVKGNIEVNSGQGGSVMKQLTVMGSSALRVCACR